MKQTILGSGGGIGLPLARELRLYTNQIRLVSRAPKAVNPDDELFPADLTNPSDVEKAIAGSEVVYVTVGFEYNLKVWQKTWPPFMQSVIDGCKRHKSRLVFFDNIYMYSKQSVPFMTEMAVIDPPSRKGLVRQQLREMIIREVEKGEISALIARAADFYGPENRNSVLTIMAIENLLKGKKAQAFGNLNCIHTYTYTPDAAKGTAMLGNTRDAFDQEWHLPTTKQRITNRGWIEIIGRHLSKEPSIQAVPAWMVRLLGVFIPVMREFPEMLYQYEQDYIFDSSKFEKRFNMVATSAEEGIKAAIDDFKRTKTRSSVKK
jgi:nucleoside-diphosphate-sugar epimerase